MTKPKIITVVLILLLSLILRLHNYACIRKEVLLAMNILMPFWEFLY